MVVIAVTNNQDYVRIISEMTMINCCFSPLVSAVNSLIKHVETENRHTVALLKRISAEVLEMRETHDSPIAHQKIKDVSFPAKMIFALIIRNDKLIPAIGNQEIIPEDQIIVLAEPKSVLAGEKLFSKKGLFS